MYKAIFIDIDGTLRNSNKQITQRTINAIKSVMEKGILVILCSGRPKKYTETVSREVGASSYVITSNGGVVYNYNKNEIIHKVTVEGQACNELYNIAQKFNCIFTMDIDGLQVTNCKEECYTERILLDTDIEIFTKENDVLLCTMKDQDFNKMKKVRKEIEKINGIEIKQEIKSFGEHNVSDKESIYYFIGNKETCKGNAIKYFCATLNIDLKDTIAIGDDFNDISMFEVVGYSVAMRNASKEVKKYANEITLSNDEEGVAVFLEKLKNIQH